MAKMCKYYNTKCPPVCDGKCERVKPKDKWVVVKGWAWVDIMNRVVAASVNKSGSIIPCEIRVRAKDLEGK